MEDNEESKISTRENLRHNELLRKSAMTRRELTDLCLTFPAAYEDYPFEAMATGNQWTAVRHMVNKKTFAFITELNGRLCANLKCDPFEADFLRQAFKDVIPGFHMNKVHWNTVFLNGDVPETELLHMIGHSYDLIKPKNKRRNKKPVFAADGKEMTI